MPCQKCCTRGLPRHVNITHFAPFRQPASAPLAPPPDAPTSSNFADRAEMREQGLASKYIDIICDFVFKIFTTCRIRILSSFATATQFLSVANTPPISPRAHAAAHRKVKMTKRCCESSPDIFDACRWSFLGRTASKPRAREINGPRSE